MNSLYPVTKKVPVSPQTQAKLLSLQHKLGGSYAQVIDMALTRLQKDLFGAAEAVSNHVQHQR